MMSVLRIASLIIATAIATGSVSSGAQIAGTVWLTVSVFDQNGGLVSGLTQGDFNVRAAGETQSLTYFSAKPAPFAAVLLIDQSGSVENVRPFIQKAAMEFVSSFRRGDRLNLATFVASTRLQGFVSTRSVIEEALAKLSRPGRPVESQVGAPCVAPAGLRDTTRVSDLTSDMDARRRVLPRRGTALWDAMECAANALNTDAEAIKRLIVVITDGQDTASYGNEQSTAMAIRKAGATVYAAGVADNDASPRALQEIADESGGRYFVLRREDDIGRAFRLLTEELRSQYILGFKPPAGVPTGNVQVTMVRPAMAARSRTTYYVNR
jgi:Ca-activated chloride channel family protein